MGREDLGSLVVGVMGELKSGAVLVFFANSPSEPFSIPQRYMRNLSIPIQIKLTRLPILLNRL